MILITGASGMLGSVVYRHFAQYYPPKQVYATMRTATPHINQKQQIIGDLCQKTFVDALIAHTNPEIIVHCAALTDLNFCEKKPNVAHQSHVVATQNLAQAAPHAYFIYLSTDSVFDGTKGNYTENDTPNPLNVYARTKLEGEAAAQYYNKNTLVLRTNIFGIDSPRQASLAEWIIAQLTARQAINGFENVVFNPLYTHTLAHAIYNLAQLRPTGILNIASPDFLSKYEFALAIAYALKLPASIVRPTTLDAHTLYPARPLNTTLNTQKIAAILPPLPTLAHDIQAMMLDYITGSKK